MCTYHEGPGHKTTHRGATRASCISRYRLGRDWRVLIIAQQPPILCRTSCGESLLWVSRKISILAFLLVFCAVTPEHSRFRRTPRNFDVYMPLCMHIFFIVRLLICEGRMRIMDTHTHPDPTTVTFAVHARRRIIVQVIKHEFSDRSRNLERACSR